MNAGDLISSEEMSALMPENEKRGTGAKPGVVPYNFRKPDRLSKDQIRAIYLLHDLFAHSLSSSLPLLLRTASEVNLISVEQQPFGDYLKGLADPTTIFTIYVPTLRGSYAVEISSPIAFPVIDRLLGGAGDDLEEKRAATDLELNIVEDFLSIICDAYVEAWKPIIPLEGEVRARETRPQMAQMVAQNEVVVTIAYQLQIGEARGSMSISIPIVTLEPVIDKFNPASYSSGSKVSQEERLALREGLKRVKFPVSTEIEPLSVRYGDLAKLGVGDILRTNHRADASVNINIGGKEKFRGSLAGDNGQLVVRIESKV
ncbi:MAG: flagellar motor switch protein FliM [Pyrinomonadaceae bacterium]